MESSLNNVEMYKKLPKNMDTKVLKKVTDFANKYSHCFDQKGKEIEYLTDFEMKTSKFLWSSQNS